MYAVANTELHFSIVNFAYSYTNKIYIAPGILKRIGMQTHGVTRW